MEVTRQLRLNQPDKNGLVQIQVTCCWAGDRLRLASGQKVLPKHWDARRSQVRERPDAYATDINQVLDDYEAAARATLHAAQGAPVSVAAMRAGIGQLLLRLRATRVATPAPPAPEVGFLDYYDQWVAGERQKMSARTGRLLSAETIRNYGAVSRELRRMSAHYQVPLGFETINKQFYERLRTYMLGVAGRSPRTFNSHIKRLRSFLLWAEDQGLPVPPRYRRTLQVAATYVGVESLTQDELLRVATIDFAAPATRAYLAGAFPEPPPPTGHGRRSLGSADHAQRCEWVRDLFLLCTYTSLRHGDAQALGWQHVHPEQRLIKKRMSKTTHVALIPYLDDDVFRPVALLESYRSLGLATCLPFVRDPWKYLPHVASLAGITRLKLGLHVGRKTYATLKVYQGVPKSLVMLATGHQTEYQFNQYLGINEAELLASHEQTARRLKAA